MSDTIIEVKNTVTKFGERVIHNGVNLHINKGEIYAILGESGAGKSVLMKQMIMLLSPNSGDIEVLGKKLKKISFKKAQKLRQQWGVLFQFGALYSSLTVAENIEIQLKEYTNISPEMREKIVYSKLDLVGLAPHVGALYPSSLSGGMVKRAGLARALAMDPKLLFLDEPTSGLDPIGARNFDTLIKELRDLLGITVVMITHDLDSIFGIVDRMAIIADKKVVEEGNMKKVLASKHPFVEKFFKNEHTQRFNIDV